MSNADPASTRARILHEIEQLSGVLADIAPLLAGFYDQLVRLGLPPEVAGQQLQTVLRVLMTAAREKREDWEQ